MATTGERHPDTQQYGCEANTTKRHNSAREGPRHDRSDDASLARGLRHDLCTKQGVAASTSGSGQRHAGFDTKFPLRTYHRVLSFEHALNGQGRRTPRSTDDERPTGRNHQSYLRHGYHTLYPRTARCKKRCLSSTFTATKHIDTVATNALPVKSFTRGTTPYTMPIFHLVARVLDTD